MHASSRFFGGTKQNIVNTIHEAITKTRVKLDSVQADLHLSDLYAHAAGIFNIEERDKRPLHSIAMHEAEENGLNSEVFDALKLYRDNNVIKYFGLSWNEMKKLTHEEFTWIMELSAEACRKDAQQVNNVLPPSGKKPPEEKK